MICEDIISDSTNYRIKPEEEDWEEAKKHLIPTSTSREEKHTCKECVGETLFKGKKAYCKNWNCELPACDNFKPKEKPSRPFEETAELILHYQQHFNTVCRPYAEPLIWVKKKYGEARFLITGFDILVVHLEGSFIDMKELFENYTFLDNSPCGILE